MGLEDLNRASVLLAVEEFDRLGREAFLSGYGFGEARTYFLKHNGRLYDSKAIAGVAHGFARPDIGPLSSHAFSGGAATVEARLIALGFDVVRVEPTEDQWTLEPGDVIRRKELHAQFGGSRQGGISPSRKSPYVFVFTDRSVGAHHGYLDRWDGTTLHYTGEGQRGNQKMTNGNRAILDHVDGGKSLRVFQGSGGDVVYIGEFGLDATEPWYNDRAPGTGRGDLRSVIMFKLVPLEEFESEGRKLKPAEVRPNLTAGYTPVSEEADPATTDVFLVDPEVADRGRRGHRMTQNAIARWAEINGYHAIRPAAGDPPFDVGWLRGDDFVVVEVKSLTLRNEIHQIRLGLGQVLDYAHQLRTAGIQSLPVLALERAPANPRWAALCSAYGVQLVWPDTFDSMIHG